MEIKTTEFFKNIKKLPPKDSPEFDQLVKWETDKILGGVTVNGVKISGWLYWHLNHWNIVIDEEDKYGNITRMEQLPLLRDIEWMRSEWLEQARLDKKAYLEVGLRQSGKSETEASITGYNAIMFKNSQNVIVGGNDDDISLMRAKIDHGLSHMWEGLAIPKIDKGWRTPMVRLGYKKKNGDDDIWSYIIVRNANKGASTEGPAGTTAKSFIIDEIGKFSFGQVYEAAKPSFLSRFGLRLIPMMMGTGGAFDKGADAERFFHNPDANNCIPVIDEKTGKKTCIFIPALYRQDFKYEMKLSDWLIQEGKLPQGNYPELAKETILVADKQLAEQTLKEERIEKSKDPDKKEYLKAVMYNPLTVEECFMSAETNIYNIELAKKRQKQIDELGDFGIPVILTNTGDGVIHSPTEKVPITSFPTAHNENKDAPPVIWEFPIAEKPPFGLYVAGVDPYRQGKTEYSDSLGAVYIFKRMHDIYSEKFQNMFVASYVARPDNIDDWHETARWLIKYYNARTLVENDELSFINYMKYMKDDHYLEGKPDWLKALAPNSKVDREYGVSTAVPKVRDHILTNLKRYSEEKIDVQKDDEGNIISETFGMQRIPDRMLLEEMKKYNGNINVDRIIAASLAITLANHLDPIVGKISDTNEDPRLKSYFNKHKSNINSPISTINPISPYRRRKGRRIVTPF